MAWRIVWSLATLSHLATIISRLDVIVSFAVTAVANQYCRPSLSEGEGTIKITEVGTLSCVLLCSLILIILSDI